MNKARWLAFLDLIRIKNLFFIALTQYLVRQFIIAPEFFYYKNFMTHSLGEWEFNLLMLATMLIAAAGYIINDYFDVNIDSINKPSKVMIGKVFSKKEAFRIHLGLNIAGSALGLLVGWMAGNYKLGLIFFLSAGLLWFYAKSFKCQFLIGNLIVSVLTALVVFLPYLFEIGLFDKTELSVAASENILPLILAYAFFAFLTTLIREITKDTQDMNGDAQYGCKTVPIVLGVGATKGLLIALSLVLVGGLFLIQSRLFADNELMQIAYILIAIQLPTLAYVFNLIPAKISEDYKKLSKLIKIIILLGILSMAVFFYV